MIDSTSGRTLSDEPSPCAAGSPPCCRRRAATGELGRRSPLPCSRGAGQGCRNFAECDGCRVGVPSNPAVLPSTTGSPGIHQLGVLLMTLAPITLSWRPPYRPRSRPRPSVCRQKRGWMIPFLPPRSRGSPPRVRRRRRYSGWCRRAPELLPWHRGYALAIESRHATSAPCKSELFFYFRHYAATQIIEVTMSKVGLGVLR